MAVIIRTTGVEEYLGGVGGTYLKCMIVGRPNSGKTRWSSFWPRPILMDFDHNRLSLVDRHMPFAEMRTSANIEDFLLRMEQEGRKAPASRSYQTLVIDTIDSYQELVTREKLKRENRLALTGWQDWGWLDATMVGFLGRVLALPMNIVVNVHLKESQDNSSEEAPSNFDLKIKGDFRIVLPSKFDLIGHLHTSWEVEDGKRVLGRTIRWEPEPRFEVLRNNSHMLPELMAVDIGEGKFGGFDEIFALQFGDNLDEGEGEELEVLEERSETVDAPLHGGPVPQDAEKTAATTKGAVTGTPAKKSEAKRPAPVKRVAEPPRPEADVEVTQPAPAEPLDEGHTEVSPGVFVPTTTPGVSTYAPEKGAPPPLDTKGTPPPLAGEDAAQAAVRRAKTIQELKERTQGVIDGGGTVTVSTEAGEPVEGPVEAPAVRLVEEELGGEVIAESEEQDPEQNVVAEGGKKCGDAINEQYPPQEEGCGKSLTGESEDVINIAELKYKASLCKECLMEANAKRKATK